MNRADKTGLFSRFRRESFANAATEMAFILPVLLVLVLATFEVGRFLLLQTKLENTSANIGDLVTRPEELSEDDVDRVLGAVPIMLRPFQVGSNSRVIVSGVVLNDVDDPPEVAWQRKEGDLIVASAVGAPGGAADIPQNLVSEEGEAVIVTEFFYEYTPWLLRVVEGQRLYHQTYFRPRRGSLSVLQPGENN